MAVLVLEHDVVVVALCLIVASLHMFGTIGMIPKHLTAITDSEATTNLLCQAIGSFVSPSVASTSVR